MAVMDKSPKAPNSPETPLLVPRAYLHDLSHFDFARLDAYKRRIRYDRLRDFVGYLSIAETEYFSANLGTKKSRDVLLSYSEVENRAKDILLGTVHHDRKGATWVLGPDERDMIAQLRKYVQMRQQIVQFYRESVQKLQEGPLDYHERASYLRGIINNMLGYLQHADLNTLKQNAEFELTALRLLFEGLHSISQFQPRDAIHSLCRARTVLSNWRTMQNETRGHGPPSDIVAPDTGGMGAFWERAKSQPVSLQYIWTSFGSSSANSTPSPMLDFSSFSEDRILNLPVGDVSPEAPRSLSPPSVPFEPSVSDTLSAVTCPKGRGDVENDSKMDTGNKFFEWLSGAINRALTKYTFVFQEVLLETRLRLYPKDKYAWPDTKGGFQLDLLGPAVAELRKAFRTPPGRVVSAPPGQPPPSQSLMSTIAGLQSKVEVTKAASINDSQMDPIKKMVEFCKANPGCTLTVLLDTSKLATFSASSCDVAEDEQPSSPHLPDAPSAVDAERASEPPEVLHSCCSQVAFCAHSAQRPKSPDTPLLSVFPQHSGIDAFQLIIQFPRNVSNASQSLNFAQNPNLKATVVSLIVANEIYLAKEAAPHEWQVLHVPPKEQKRTDSGPDRALNTYSYYISQLDRKMYACIISEKAKEKGKNIIQFIKLLTKSLRDSNQMGYLVTPKFDYEKNLI